MGRPLGSKNRNYIPLDIRLYSKISGFTDSGCWEMQPPKGHRYPNLQIRNKSVRASRVSWEIFHKKKFPKGKFCLHQCDNTKCINPGHLFIGSHKQNMRDMIKKGRDKKDPPVGERCAQHVLKENNVREIRGILKKADLSKRGLQSKLHREIGKRFNVSDHTIYAIHKRISWRHI